MPDNIVRQPVNAVPRPLRHFRKALRLSLVLERVAREIDPTPMHIGFHDDVDATDAIERDFDVFVFPPVALEGHVVSQFEGFEVLVAFGKDEIFVFFEGGNDLEGFGGFLPGVVVNCE